MYKFVVAVLVFCVFKDAASYSCFRNPSSAPCGENGQCMISCGGSCSGPFCSRTSSNVDYPCSCGCDQISPVCSCLKSLNQDCGCSTISSCGCNSYSVPSSCGCNSYSVPSSCGCNSYSVSSCCGCNSYNVPSSCGCNSYSVPSSCGCNSYSVPSSCGCNSYNILVPTSCGCNSYNLGGSCDVPSCSCGCGCGSCIRSSTCGTPSIYFPEVEYPVVTCNVPSAYYGCVDDNPFYYGVCWDR